MENVSVKFLPLFVLGLALVVSLSVGMISRRQARSGYGVQFQSIGHASIGAAIASNWMSAASFLGIAGVFFVKGYFAFAYVLGWTGGYVLLLVLMGSQLRRFGKYTASDFVEARYESSLARVFSAIIAILITLIYCVAQYKGIGLIFGWIFGIDYTQSLVLGVVITIGYLVVAGAMGATRNQQMHYLVLIVSFVVPLAFISNKLGYGMSLPQFTYGRALLDLPPDTARDYLFPWTFGTAYEWIALSFTLMVGTAGLPHVLSRFYTVPNNRDARWGVVWGLFFIGLLYWSAPAFGAFAKVWQVRSGMELDAQSAYQLADLVVVKIAEWTGIPEILLSIIAVGGILAAMSTITGLLITGAGAFAYDIYYRLINPKATEQHLLQVAKAATLVLAGVILLVALNPPGLIAQITAIAFALAGNTLFPVFLLGIWWDRANKQGALAGMLIGTLITFSPLLFGNLIPGLRTILPPTSSALIGAPVVILSIIIVSLMTPPPPEALRRFLVEKVHSP
ncbi:MAG: cation acetate symporter [Deltaproteobacteria bacterium]|jgi:cation/acetate symporter|nr:cation acetate symporter [Deltaproteobacteria bacterium]MBW2520942.1 cation acetate symporter [Deltaproteobacteria bacterium]